MDENIPLSCLPENDPRRRHLSEKVPVHSIVWPESMTEEEKKSESEKLYEEIPRGYHVALEKQNGIIILAYSETCSALLRFLTKKNLRGKVIMAIAHPPDAIGFTG